MDVRVVVVNLCTEFGIWRSWFCSKFCAGDLRQESDVILTSYSQIYLMQCLCMIASIVEECLQNSLRKLHPQLLRFHTSPTIWLCINIFIVSVAWFLRRVVFLILCKVMYSSYLRALYSALWGAVVACSYWHASCRRDYCTRSLLVLPLLWCSVPRTYLPSR